MAQETVEVEKKHLLSDSFIEERIYGFLVNYPFEVKNPDEKKYIAKIKDAVKNDTFVIGIDYEDIYSFFQGLNPDEEEDDDTKKEVMEYQEAFDEIIKRLNKNPLQITKILPSPAVPFRPRNHREHRQHRAWPNREHRFLSHRAVSCS